MSVLMVAILFSCSENKSTSADTVEEKIDSLLSVMTLEEKIGQTWQVSGTSPEIVQAIRNGGVGSLLNVTDPAELNAMQRLATEESRLGIPLIIGRDVIHGFKTIMPIPLGQAASWDEKMVEAGAAVAAAEARSTGIHWTFAPMLDVSRDARWGRIAESLGEDTYLTGVLGAAMVRGFQGESLSSPTSLAACAKHFAAYGAAEGGRDYNTVDISDATLHNVYLPPFKASADAGAATFMVSFNEISGIPSSGNRELVTDILKQQWAWDGFVVSDWASVMEMIPHGYAEDAAHAAELAMNAGVDMEMQTTAYPVHLKELIEQGIVPMEQLDDAVRRVLRIKFALGLFEDPYADEQVNFDTLPAAHLEVAREMATASLVLLKNEANILPLNVQSTRVAVIGPMADDGYEQLGTWVFDGEERHSVTPLTALRELVGNDRILYEKALAYTRDTDRSSFAKAKRIVLQADAAVIFVGEESILSGEAHSRADITLPGAQAELIREIKSAGKPVVVVVMAGRPLALKEIEPWCDAILYAWHPGTMGGPAIADVLFGESVPSGKLPVSFPAMSGQTPLYYNHKRTGRPADPGNFTYMEDIPVRAFQTSLGNTSHYIDAGYAPLYPFGFGLSYTTFEYNALTCSDSLLTADGTLQVAVKVKNTGQVAGQEVVQLYVHDRVGSLTRPVKELKAYRKILLQPGEEQEVSFGISPEMLAYWYNGEWITEPGEFEIFIGTNIDNVLGCTIRFTE